MSAVRPMRNTEKDFPCTRCGAPGNVIREGANPRLKCVACNFMFDASDSLAAKEAGNVPQSVPEMQDNVAELPRANAEPKEIGNRPITSPEIPRTPSYVFVSKDRAQHEFCTRRDLTKTALKWQLSDDSYDVFELSPKKINAKISIE